MFEFSSVEHLRALQKKGFTTFLLDWDGCMVAKAAWPHLRVFVEAAKQLGFNFTIEQAYRAYVGPKHGIDWYLLMKEALLPKYGDQGMPKEAFREFCSLVRSCAQNILDDSEQLEPIEPLPGARQFVENAASVFGRNNLLTITATPGTIARIMMRATSFERFLSDNVYGCERLWLDDGRIVEKSEKFVWQEPAADVGASLSQCILVEDGSAGSRFALGSDELGGFLSLTKKNWDQTPQNPNCQFWCASSDGDWNSIVLR